jgi:hypothetical protein
VPAREGIYNIQGERKEFFGIKSEDLIQIGRIFSNLISPES